VSDYGLVFNEEKHTFEYNWETAKQGVLKNAARGVFFFQVCRDLPLQFINTKELIFPKQVAVTYPGTTGLAVLSTEI
jgi:hypothetical protein